MRTSFLIILLTILAMTSGRAQQTVGLFLNEEGSTNGYTLLSPNFSYEVYLIDNCGEVVHTWNCSTLPGLSNYLLDDGTLLRTGRETSPRFGGGGTGGLIEQLDWDSNVIWSYTLANDTIHQHHDIEPMPNGNILVLLWGYLPQDEATALGRDPDLVGIEGLWPTEIVEIAPIGIDSADIVWHWRMRDHLIQDVDPLKPDYGVISEHPERLNINFTLNSSDGADWLHCNSIDYNPILDQILLSSRQMSEIFIIDHSTSTSEAAGHSGGLYGQGGDLLYRYGNPANYDRETALYGQTLFLQHDAQWVTQGYPDQGKISVFNNIGGGDLASSVNIWEAPQSSPGEYLLNGENAFGPVFFDWSYIAPDFYSQNISGANELYNGNILICEGREGRIFEVDQNGNIHWEYVSPASSLGTILSQGTVPTSNHLFRADRFPVDHPAFIGRDLSPLGPLELEPLTSNCVITSLTEAEEDFIQTYHISNERLVMSIDEEVLSMSLIDLAGREVRNATKGMEGHWLDLHGINSGLYIVFVESELGQRSLKIHYTND